MKTERAFFPNWAFVMAIGAAIAGIMLIAFLGATETMPGQGIAVIALLLAIYLLVVGTGIVMASMTGGLATAETVGLAAEEAATAASVPELELMDAVPVAPLSPVTIGVAGVTGVCALGFRPGHTWVVDSDGGLSRPLCQPGVVALSSMLRSLQREGVKLRVPCNCPLGNREVAFAVQEEEPASV